GGRGGGGWGRGRTGSWRAGGGGGGPGAGAGGGAAPSRYAVNARRAAVMSMRRWPPPGTVPATSAPPTVAASPAASVQRATRPTISPSRRYRSDPLTADGTIDGRVDPTASSGVAPRARIAGVETTAPPTPNLAGGPAVGTPAASGRIGLQGSGIWFWRVPERLSTSPKRTRRGSLRRDGDRREPPRRLRADYHAVRRGRISRKRSARAPLPRVHRRRRGRDRRSGDDGRVDRS